MAFLQYDRIVVINLAHRRDRRREMEREFAKVGLSGDRRVSFFDACMFDDAGDFYSRGARGCYESHLGILREAADLGQSVLIVEDDADFSPACKTYIVPPGTEIFYGGYTLTSHADPLVSDIVGSHMMGFSATVVPLLVDYFSNVKYEGKHPPIDGAYVWYRRAFPEVATHFAQPPIAYQRPSRTDVGDSRFFDKVSGLREAVQVARKIKSRLLKYR